MEEKIRKEKADKLKERVQTSKALVDNRQSLEEKKRKQQNDFKNSVKDTKMKYEEELARRIQRVYNKPLMFETVTQKADKFSQDKNMQDKLNNIAYYDEDEPQEESKHDNRMI
jgi:hypothetical protein